MYNCVRDNLYEYLWLLREYRQNDIGLWKGINKCDLEKTEGFTPLTKLIVSNHCNQDWLTLLLSFPSINVNHRCENKDERYFGKHALDLIKDERLKNILVSRL